MKNGMTHPVMMRMVSMLIFLLVAEAHALAADFPQGLMLHFSFDQWEGGGVVTDKTGRGNNGRAFGAKWTALGKQAGGFDFTATNNYIQVNHSPTLSLTQATFAVWFKTVKSDAISRYIFEKSSNHGFALSVAGDARGIQNRGKLRFSINGHECLSDQAVTDVFWHHAAAVFDGKSLKLFVDGHMQQQVTDWKGGVVANTNDLSIGLNRSSPAPEEKGVSFEGTLDEFMVFNHALSEVEITTVIAAAKPKYTKEQVRKRLAELKELLDRGLILPDFYTRKVKECEVTE